ncbi:MAG: PD-(D/E)XK nuclease family protein [Polyangiaceae bacterium]
MRISASKLGLAARCAYWARPDVELPPEGPPSVAAELGTALHAVAEGRDYADVAQEGGFDPDALAALVAEWQEWWPGYSEGRAWQKEAPYAYDVATGRGRILPSEGHRDYSAATETEYCATVDAVSLDGVPTVLDLKTGWKNKTVAAYREQLELGALAVARTHGLDRVRIAIAHVTGSGVVVDETRGDTDLDEFDLADVEARLRALAAGVPTSEPNPGEHCLGSFCPEVAACPVTVATLQEIPAARPLALTGEIETDEDAERLLQGLPMLEAWCNDRRAAVRRRALATGGIRMSDGRVYLATINKRESIRLDVPGALEVMRVVLGEHTERALTVKTSKEAIERAVRVATSGKRGELGKLKTKVLDALRDAGAIKTTQYEDFEFRKPALPAKDGA